jgi:dynein heavy chain
MATPPAGVGDVFTAVAVLLAGIEPAVIVQKTGKVKPEHRTWDAVKRALLTNIQGFVDLLREFKSMVDEFRWVPLESTSCFS